MKRPSLGLLACSCAALLVCAGLFSGATYGTTIQTVDRFPQKKAAPQAPASEQKKSPRSAPAKVASNAPGTAAPVYNQQRTGSTDPLAVAARQTPKLAAPEAYDDQTRLVTASHPELIDDPTLYDEGGVSGCATCQSGNCGEANCGGGLTDCVPCNYFALNGWYIGGDYVNARTNFSDPGAIVVRNVANGGLDFHDQIVPYDLGYQSTFRVNAGYRWGTCGESLNFSYSNFNDNTVVNSPEVNAAVVVAGPFALNCNPGEHLRTGLEAEAHVYDLDYAKRIPICTGNCDPCSCGGGCPPWAITWSAGARVGTLDLYSPTQLFAVGGALLEDAYSSVTFTGAGPKVALEGRRYIGDCQRWSAYGKSSLALLLGQYDVEMQRTTIGAPNEIARQTHNYTRVVPMIDLEVGLSQQLGKKTLLTAGYFMQVWIDASTVNNLTQPGVGILAPADLDDANMTMFDGFMLRVERVF